MKILMKYGQLNLTRLALKDHSNFATVQRYLKILEAESIVQQQKYGRRHYYRLANSPKSKAIQELIDAWECKEQH